MENFDRHVGQMFLDLRKVRGLSRDTVSSFLGMNQTSLRRIEIGERKVQLIDFIRLCDVYDVDATEVLQEIIPEAPKPKPLTVEIGGKTYRLTEVEAQ